MQIIFSDENVLVVNKPAGISVLPEGWDKDANYLVKELETLYKKVWVVHRIDKITSGIIAFALNAETHRSLNIQFEKHQVEKKYHAILNGSPKWDEKVTKFPLRVNVGHKHRTVVDDRNGVNAETKFKVEERYQASTLIEAMPMTGRTHQIRVHAYALGHPLVGDVLYSAPESKIIHRPALHARSLIFTHPATGNKVSFEADYPDDFREAVETSRRFLSKA
jgi:RluA family pseudouridine synthase